MSSTPSIPSKRTSRGVTLIEAATIVAICAVSASAAAPSMRSLLDLRRLTGHAGTLAADLQLARNEAIARNQPVRWSWYAAQSCYVLHTGSAAQCACADSGPAVCQGDARQIRTARLESADRLTLQTNAASIVFDPLHGTASPAATLRLSALDGRALHHIVNVMGRVRSCSPLSAVPGQPAC